MANRKQHIILGATAGVGGYAIYTYIKEEKPSLPELIGAGLSGAAGSLLPDLIEPATNPNHRSFFHSVSFAAVAGPRRGHGHGALGMSRFAAPKNASRSRMRHWTASKRFCGSCRLSSTDSLQECYPGFV